jgi:hypothetical protein
MVVTTTVMLSSVELQNNTLISPSVSDASGNLCEPLDDGTGFSYAPGQLDVADGPRSAQREANDVGRGNTADTFRGDRHSESGGYETQDGQPVRRFLNNLGTKAMGFTKS